VALDLHPLVYVVIQGGGSFGRALSLCQKLRQAGVSCELGQEGKSLNSQMRSAGASGAVYAVLVGADIVQVGLKNLTSGEQEQVGETDLLRRVKPATA